MAQPYLDRLILLVQTMDLARNDLECRHFFSGAAVYVSGSICVSLTPKGLGLKLPEARCAELIAGDLAEPLRYFDQAPIKKGYALFSEYENLSNATISGYFQECISYVSA